MATSIEIDPLETLGEKGNQRSFMDCKRALAETGGDLEATLLRRGIASAGKEVVARPGIVASYIHLQEVGCWLR
jgi:translation elongation factor EF-Ts